MSTATAVPAALEAVDITKKYGVRRALDNVSLRVAPASVHALLGKNGAGKSTLVKIIAGFETADAGVVSVGSQPGGAGVRAHEAAGVFYVPQELTVFRGMTVADQILLGDRYPRTRMRTIRRRRGDQAAQEALNRLDPTIDPAVRVDALSLPQLRTIMVARALHTDAKVLLLDEPTEAFSRREVDALFAVLRSLTAAGVSIVYVSHRLSEVFDLADTVTVLRDGKLVIAGQALAAVSRDEVVTAVVNEPGGFHRHEPPQHRAAPTQAAPCMTWQAAAGGQTFSLACGSVIGLAGVAGSGRTATLRCIASPAIDQAQLNTNNTDGLGLRRRQRATGVVLLPEDRVGLGLLPALTVRENITIGALNRFRRGRTPVLGRRQERSACLAAMRAVGLDPTVLNNTVTTLSGGNQQKVLLARGVVSGAKIWLLDEPTVGLDLHSRSHILRLIRELAAQTDGSSGTATGAAVVASSDLDDLIEACDEVYVLHDGQVTAHLTAPITEDQLMHATIFTSSELPDGPARSNDGLLTKPQGP